MVVIFARRIAFFAKLFQNKIQFSLASMIGSDSTIIGLLRKVIRKDGPQPIPSFLAAITGENLVAKLRERSDLVRTLVFLALFLGDGRILVARLRK